MRVKNIAMDITDVEFNGENQIVIAHGVNCQGAMGQGVARAISDRWPVVKSEYKRLPKRAMTLGRIQPVSAEKGITVFNCFTQEFYGNDGKRYADPDAVASCLRKVLDYMQSMELRKPTLYIPRIGCDRGGLDWKEDIGPTIKELAREYNDAITMVVCNYNL